MKLKIIETNSQRSTENFNKPMNEETKAYFERLWLLKDKHINILTKERIKRSLTLLTDFCDPKNKKVCDLGCGEGLLSIALEELGANIDAVDISQNALKRIESKEGRIRLIQDRVPRTRLNDDSYDIVSALDLIAELPKKEHRLFFMEIARLVNQDGFVLVSTPLDFRSENALDLFIELARSELDIKSYYLSYHRLFIRLLDFVKAPRRFYQSSIEGGYRQRSLSKRVGLSKRWFSFNSKKWIGTFWGFIAPLADRLSRSFENSPKILEILEKFSKAVSGENALTHVILIGKRKPLFVEDDFPQEPIKIKTRKWE